ncbi:unnamed protein product [Parascedosporium putredinis]|uniref:Transcription factor domain-containing protein n=1 Tax=Parascedosporium putredinis TaxID=1442378 RepID=A0A9P1H392_9PEZI|nr:unnamed protein product [Parascedosporium putredinis]CAI7996812.1 unnamed protein product [Parascedosporium putredinis]
MGILSSPRFDIPLATYHPSKLVATQLWKIYVDNVDPCSKILHIPTDEVVVFTAIDDPINASSDAMALCFAVYYAATIARDADTAQGVVREEMLPNLQQFKTGLELAFAHADFWRTRLSYYCKLWGFTSPLCAYKIPAGLGLSVFDSEIRRRVWWHFIGRDGRAAEDYGFQNVHSPSLMSGAALPLNLDDADLYPTMERLPPPRVGWTRMTMAIVSIDVAKTWSKMLQLDCSPANASVEATRAEIVGDLRRRTEKILQYCTPVVPQQRMTVRIARLIMRKLDVVTRQQWQAMRPSTGQRLLLTEETLMDAVSVLDEADSIPNAARAFDAVEDHLAQIRLQQDASIRGSKWIVLMALKSKAISMRAKSQNPEASESNAGRVACSSRPADAVTRDVSPSGGGVVDVTVGMRPLTRGFRTGLRLCRTCSWIPQTFLSSFDSLDLADRIRAKAHEQTQIPTRVCAGVDREKRED